MSIYNNIRDYLKKTQVLNPAIILDICEEDGGGDGEERTCFYLNIEPTTEDGMAGWIYAPNMFNGGQQTAVFFGESETVYEVSATTIVDGEVFELELFVENFTYSNQYFTNANGLIINFMNLPPQDCDVALVIENTLSEIQ